MKLLEKVLPKFFKGASKVWESSKAQSSRRYATAHKQDLSNEAREILKKQMWADYEIYNFIEKRFREANAVHGLE